VFVTVLGTELAGTITAVVPGIVTTDLVTDVGNEDLGTKTGLGGNFVVGGKEAGTVGGGGVDLTGVGVGG
jgi:hypothetical protein